MNLYIDAEWSDCDLISMALVDEGGREWYRALHVDAPSEWVAENVIPKIGPTTTLEEMQRSLQEWLSVYEAVHIVADWPEDIARFCMLLITSPGKRLKTPLLTMEIDRSLDSNDSEVPHHALHDARAIRKMHRK